MATIKNFEELEVWQKSMDFCDEVFKLINETDLNKDFALRDQMNRSSISIPSNISEGFDRESNNQFSYFLKVAKGSAGELRTQLYLCKRRGYIEETKFQKLSNDIIQISKKCSSLLAYLRDHKKKNHSVSEPEIEYLKSYSIELPNNQPNLPN